MLPKGQRPAKPPSLETGNWQGPNYFVREIKVFDQYSPALHPLIQRLRLPESLCGFVSAGIAPYLAEKIAFFARESEVAAVFRSLASLPEILPKIEFAATAIQSQRAEYIRSHPQDFKDPSEKERYFRDWVANFEASDFFLRCLPSETHNVFLIHECSMKYPHLTKDLKHEELDRLKDEAPFSKEAFVITVYFPQKEMLTIAEFHQRKYTEIFRDTNRSSVFMANLNGHFVVLLGCCVEGPAGRKENSLFLLSSVAGNALNCREMIELVGNLVFLS